MEPDPFLLPTIKQKQRKWSDYAILILFHPSIHYTIHMDMSIM